MFANFQSGLLSALMQQQPPPVTNIVRQAAQSSSQSTLRPQAPATVYRPNAQVAVICLFFCNI